jgi:hypothetical protein
MPVRSSGNVSITTPEHVLGLPGLKGASGLISSHPELLYELPVDAGGKDGNRRGGQSIYDSVPAPGDYSQHCQAYPNSNADQRQSGKQGRFKRKLLWSVYLEQRVMGNVPQVAIAAVDVTAVSAGNVICGRFPGSPLQQSWLSFR